MQYASMLHKNAAVASAEKRDMKSVCVWCCHGSVSFRGIFNVSLCEQRGMTNIVHRTFRADNIRPYNTGRNICADLTRGTTRRSFPTVTGRGIVRTAT